MFREYTVQSGDTLSKIAEQFYGDTALYNELARFNGIENPDSIEVGQVIEVPHGYYNYDTTIEEEGLPVIVIKSNPFLEDDAPEIDSLMIFCPQYVGTGKAAYMYIPAEDSKEFVEKLNLVDLDRKEYAKLLKEARGIKDPVERTKSLEKLEKEFNEKYVVSLKADDAKPNFQELIILNKWKPEELASTYHYIKTDDIKEKEKKWIVESAEELEKKMRKDAASGLSSKKKLSDYVSAKVKASLWKMENPPEGQIFPEWRFCSSKDAFKENENIDGSYDVAFLRYAANAEAGMEFDAKELKLSVGVEGSASFSLVEGKASIELHLPDKDGEDLFQVLEHIFTDKLLKDNRKCNIKLILKGELYGFIGANAAISLPKLDIDLKGKDASMEKFRDGADEKQKAVAEVGASAFAGASGTISACFEGQWQNVYAKNQWGTLAKQGGQLSGRAGIGAEAGIKFDFQGGKIIFKAGVGVVVGLGGKAELIYEMDIIEGCQLIGHLCESVAYHNVIEISASCFKVYYKFRLYMLTKTVEYVDDLRKGVIVSIKDWWAGDDRYDYKKNKLELDPDELRQTPPEALGRLIQLIMKSHQKDDFDRILRILEQSREDLKPGQRNHELRWIIRYITKDHTEDVKISKEKYLKEGIQKLRDFFDDPAITPTSSQQSRIESLVVEAQQ